MKSKSKLMREADKLWYVRLLQPHCEVCGDKAIQVHHFFYKGSYGHLRYDLDNGISICRSCHYKIHFKDPKPINDIIIKKRGKRWYNRLKKRGEQRKSSFKSIKYYEDVIKKLKK